MIGPFINSAGIISGSILGAVCAKNVSAEFRKKLNYVFTCITLGIGVFMTAKGHALPPVIISLLFGAILGELLGVESGVMRLAFRAVDLFHRKKPAATGLPQQTFRDQFAVVTVLFCVSSLGIMRRRIGQLAKRAGLTVRTLHHLPLFERYFSPEALARRPLR